MKKIFVSTLILSLLMFSGYTFLEPQEVFALEDQITVTQSVTAEITITSPANVTMSPSLAGITGGASNGYAQWTVVTSSLGGFTATLTASGTPSQNYVLLGNTQGDFIENYTEGTYNVPDYAWSVTNAAEFGYTATTTTPADISQAFKTTSPGSGPCNAGSNVAADTCWIGASTTARQLVNRTSEAPSGTNLGVHFQVQLNNHTVVQDTYVATTTITAVVQ